MLRTPLLPVHAELSGYLHLLKSAIQLSSPDFYALIQDCEADDVAYLPSRIKFTLWKYFNRARFRATPFGSFGSVSLLEIGQQSFGSAGILIDSEQKLHRFVDWSFAEGHSSGIMDFPLDLQQLLFSNSSYYVIKDSIRVITRSELGYQISEFSSSDLVMKILSLCAKPISVQSLLSSLNAAEADQVSEQDLLIGMVEAQLLLSSGQPNIIGPDYLKGLALPEDPMKQYMIAERKVLSGGLSGKLLRQLESAIGKLACLSSPNSNRGLSDFVSRFAAKFGDRSIPLMQALDAEAGVGYQDLELFSSSSDVALTTNEYAEMESADGKIKAELLARLSVNSPLHTAGIDLGDIDVEDSSSLSSLPNTFNVIGTNYRDELWVSTIGGCTANAIYGRFSLEHKGWTNACRKIAGLEQNANPDVVFFDVGYTGDPLTDNINRRASIYNFELNILNLDVSENPVLISDIVVQVIGNEVILSSKLLNKRLVPRIASAYNYQRSDLSLLRFLCDLQYQGLHSNLGINLPSLVPGLGAYPRVYFKNIVLAPARWLVDYSAAQVISEDDLEAAILRHFELRNIPIRFKTGISDQVLCFNLDDASDLWAFSMYLKKEGTCYVSECPAPDSCLTRDHQGNVFQDEFVLSCYHDREIYPGSEFANRPAMEPVSFLIPPGGIWLYFEIYCHTNYSDALLLNSLSPLLLKFQHKIEKWFFIRYNQGGDHIRLRICLNDSADSLKVTGDLSDLLQADLELGLVSELLIKSYKREVERYSGIGIEAAESHFHLDSEFVMSVLPLKLSAMQLFKLLELTITRIADSGVMSHSAFEALISIISEGYNLEFKLKKSDFRKLNQIFSFFIETESPSISESIFEKQMVFIQSLIDCLQNCGGSRKDKLFTDFIHMHINRLFTNNQKELEMNFYYLQNKLWKSKKHIPKPNLP